MKPFGCIIDIDGVLIRDGCKIEGADKGIKLLEEHKVPYCLLTNGHGNAQYKADIVNKALGTHIAPEQIVLAVSPLKDLVDDFKDKPVLIVGKEMEMDTVRSFGFKHPIYYEDYATLNPAQFPDRYQAVHSYSIHSELDEHTQIAAIFIAHTPLNWGEAIQIICDVLRSKDGSTGSIMDNELILTQRVPIYLCNPDFDYAGKFSLPRMTVGAFGTCLNTIWKSITNQDLNIQFMGKPYRLSYKMAENVILKHNNDTTLFYGIGDNPISDIRGANNMKIESPYSYTSVLVESGCGNEESLKKDPPDIVSSNFLMAVKTILKMNGISIN
ncbi:cat eye syndrome critical region protein 5 precursor, putative [Entamoeba dispar SAW760]|uniref:Cat eye syndrome critical region protein 5, putative n=1 Tax=Entamoeba dispar (strain ATCC PRA-260 / SAW760) TaxID=370354 RepID=B0EPS7_ENTDS|nr:cat eye syndrome critical region protein 5 precursor, putative [Entamoeba dispar SAW760]EDR23507.1 cat eye syndrome critical region protein 5 precursor, putative [Entamoeba dispar SAW760]|eukprot:EDR23507.1 cat eye syndrome critical region protein 5 precursor, putative [Entamoeba dispar SAW760]